MSVCGTLLSLSIGLGLQAQTSVFNTAQAASRVIGQPDYTSNRPGEEAFQLGSPTHVTVLGKKMLLSDGGFSFTVPNNNRVLIYNDYTALQGGSPANLVLGQKAFGFNCGADSKQSC